MFAPHVPSSASRPASAGGHHSYAHQPYDLPSSPILSRRNSLSWRPEAGLPPPPSQIDSLGDSINRALIPSLSSKSPVCSRSSSPSRYDVEFGSLHDAISTPFNSVTKHPKVKLEIVLNSNLFEAGGSISGQFQLTCTTSQRLRLGDIAIELEGIEQITSTDHAASQLFLYNRTLFQGEHLPPSNAVLPAAPLSGYWTARKGRTTFPFKFRLPSTVPSCVTFAGNASLRYHLKASVQTWYNEEKMVVTARREAFVVERWSDEFDEKYQQPAEAVGDTRLFMGGNGAVWLEAGVAQQLFSGGGQMLIRCGIKNNTKRQVSGVKVSLARRLIFPVANRDQPSDQLSLEPVITEIVHQQVFKGREYEFPPNQEAVCNVDVDIPKDLRTIRKTRLFEVRTFAIVSLNLGSFAKDLTVEVPVYIAHTASVQKPAQQDLSAVYPNPHPQNQRSHSSIGHPNHVPYPLQHHQHPLHPPHPHQHPHSHHQVPPSRSDPSMLAVERDRSPAPTHQMNAAPPARSASAAAGMIQLPATPQPFSISPQGQVDWNPSVTGWSASQLPTTANIGNALQRSASAAPDLRHASQQPHQQPIFPAWQPPPRPVSASPAPNQLITLPPHPVPVPVPVPHAAPPLSSQMANMSLSPTPSIQQYHHHHQQQQQQQHQQHQQPSRRASLPNPGIVPLPAPSLSPMLSQDVLPSIPEPQPVLQSYEQTNTPDTYGSSYQGGPLFAFPSQPGMSPLIGLATIEEDGESQAGTVKTIHKLPTVGKNNGKTVPTSSVSKNNIEQFEAIANAEEDDVKREMRTMGMEPDEDAFNQARKPESSLKGQSGKPESSLAGPSKDSHVTSTQESTSKVLPQVPKSTNGSQAVSMVNRPRADQIFAVGQKAREEGSRDLHLTEVLAKDAPTSLALLRRSSTSHGLGLDALESKLVRSTTPKIPYSPSLPVVTLADVGKDSNPNSSGSSPTMDESSRSRKESALRAAAAARDAAKKELEERERQEAEERRRHKEEQERARRETESRQKEEAERAAVEIAQHEEQDRLVHAKENEEREADEAERQRQRQRQQEEEEERQRQRQRQQEEEEERQRQRQRQEAEEEEERQRRRQQQQQGALRARLEKEAERVAAPQVQYQPTVSNDIKRTEASGVIPTSNLDSRRSIFAGQSDRTALQKGAVGRIAGWLSSSTSISNNSRLEAPGTPSGSAISLLKKEDDKVVDKVTLSRSPSQVINPLWHGKANDAKVVKGISRSKTISHIASEQTEGTRSPRWVGRFIEEPAPKLSAELRALVDRADVIPTKRAGTALRDHPMSRRISASLQIGERPPVEASKGLTLSSPQVSVKRGRHTSLPVWPKPALPHFGTGVRPLPGSLAVNQVSLPVPNVQSMAPPARKSQDIFTAEDKAIVIPSRVVKTLTAAEEDVKRPTGSNTSYDSRSARGGRGGRVASVAQLWVKIAGDAVTGESSNDASALAPPSTTFKPKARRTSSIGGAPALDFSKKKLNSIAASFAAQSSSGSTKPVLLKSGSAPQYLNTSVSKPVFSHSSTSATSASALASVNLGPSTSNRARRPLPQPQVKATVSTDPTLVRPVARLAAQYNTKSPSVGTQASASKGVEERVRVGRRISADLLQTFDKPPTQRDGPPSVAVSNSPSIKDATCKMPVDSTVLSALSNNDEAIGSRMMEKLRNAATSGTEVKMSGRGTTKAIGQSKVQDLRAVWGS